MIYIFASTQRKAALYKKFGKHKGAKTFGNKSNYSPILFQTEDTIFILPGVNYDIRKKLAIDFRAAKIAGKHPEVHWVGQAEYV